MTVDFFSWPLFVLRFTFDTFREWPTLRRILILLALPVVLPAFEVWIWTGLLLDRLCFRGFEREPIQTPLFVVGHYRSGTTLLHRMLAKDDRFSTMALWEVLFAPAVSHRVLVRAAVSLDTLIGGPGAWLLRKLEAGWGETNVMHEVALAAPEEDEYLLLHIWRSLTIGLSSGCLDLAQPYARFDRDLPRPVRDGVFEFYRSCITRHLVAHRRRLGRGGVTSTYLAKNPALTPKLETLLEHFPDARIVLLRRDHEQTVSSFTSMMEYSWRVMGTRLQEDSPRRRELRTFIDTMAREWLEHARSVGERLPPAQFLELEFDELSSAPKVAVEKIYRQFGLEITPSFSQRLVVEDERARSYESRHHYQVDHPST